MKIGFIGAGKVGFSIGKYLKIHGKHVIGYYSQSPKSAKEAAEFTQTRLYKNLDTIVEDSDLLFLTVPDGAIQTVWESIKHLELKGKILCHCSGSLSSTVFSDIEQLGSFGYSIHPLFAISSKEYSYQQLNHAVFTLEGSEGKKEIMLNFMTELGNQVQCLATSSKVKYHSAAVFVSNHVTALMELGCKLLMECGFTEETANNALIPLFIGNATTIAKEGTTKALTGPVERNDINTISRHLECLNSQQRQLYCLLTKELLEIGKRKHPTTDYRELETIIGEIS